MVSCGAGFARAGSRPTGKVQPLALALIGRAGFPTLSLRSKSWAEFARPGAPRLDYVITVCDGAASEPCPIFPGEAVRIHWPLPDPAAPGIPGAKREQAFAAVFQTLLARVRALDAALLTSIGTPAITDLLRQLGSEAPCVTSGAQMEWLLILAALVLAFSNGANDNFKGFATAWGRKR